MQIAVIGWGSLIWCPESLRIKTRWHSDGPALPIEFARISADKRLTLVIHIGSPDQRTYWALSQFESLEQARENLRAREGTNLEHIHSLATDGDERREGEIDRQVAARIREWLNARQNVQAAIWTGLPGNWDERRGHAFSPEDAFRYLQELEEARDQAISVYNRAREYVTNAPPQIQTVVREMVRKKIGWKDSITPPILLEPGPSKADF